MNRHLKTRRRFNILRLEDRITPAISTTYDPVYAALTVTSDAADSIVIGTNSDGRVTNHTSAILDSSGHAIEARLIQSIRVIGGPGNNVIDLSGVESMAFEGLANFVRRLPGRPKVGEITITRSAIQVGPIVIDGGSGSDTITGSQFADYIECTSGADVVTTGGGQNTVLISNDDIASVTVTGNPFGDDELLLAYKPRSGKIISCDFDYKARSQSISYDGKTVFATNVVAVDVQNAHDEMQIHLSDSGGGGGGAGGSIEFTQPLGSEIGLLEISGPPASSAAAKPGRVKWSNIVLKRGITSSMDAWNWRVDPSSDPVSIECTGAANTITVNTFGFDKTTTASSVQVAGMAAITFTGMGSVTTEERLYDTAALIDLQARGVTISTSHVEYGDGTRTLTMTVSNNSTITMLKTEWITSIGLPKVTPKIAKESHGHRVLPPGRIIGVTPGAGVEVEFHDTVANLPVASLAAGMPWSQEVTFTMPTLQPGQSSTSSADCRSGEGCGNGRLQISMGGVEYDIDISSYFETGDRPTEVQFAGVLDSGLAVTPSGGPTVLIATDASGEMALVASGASGIDPDITAMTAGAHLYIGQQMVDVAADGHSSGNAPATVAEMSLDGRFVIFVSSATNLVSGLSDTNGASDVFLRDTVIGKTYCLSAFTDTLGATSTGNGASFDPHISADGNMILFRSLATNLVAGLDDTNGEADAFAAKNIREIAIDELNIDCMSMVAGLNITRNKGVIAVDLNGDSMTGYTIAYVTEATGGDVPATPGWHTWVYKEGYPVKWEGPELSASFSGGLTVSLDGSTVVLWTATDLSNMAGVPDNNGVSDIVAIDAATGAARPISVTFLGTAMADGPSPAHAGERVAVSLDGSHIAFTSFSSNLVAGLAAPATDGLYRFREVTGIASESERIDTVGAVSFGADNHAPSISADGTAIAWGSTSNYKSGGATFSKIQAWVKDCYDGKEVRKDAIQVTVTPFDGVSDGAAFNWMVDSTGDEVAFTSDATNIVPGDNNGQPDVFGSRRHRTFTIQVSDLPPVAEMTLRYDEPTDSYQLVQTGSSIVLASRAAEGVTSVYIRGRDNVGEVWTVDTSTGLQRLGGNIVINGGSGGVPDQVTFRGVTGDRILSAISTRDGTYSITVTRGTLLPILGGGLGEPRDIMADVLRIQGTGIEVINDDSGADEAVYSGLSGNVSVTANGSDLIVTSGGITRTRLGSFGQNITDLQIVLSTGNDSVTVNMDGLAAGVSENLEIFGNGGNDTVTNGGAGLSKAGPRIIHGDQGPINDFTTGAGNDTLTIGAGAGTLNGGAGGDAYRIVVLQKVFPGTAPPTGIVDSSGSDTLDFSGAGIGVSVDMDSQSAQTIAPGRSLQMTGTIENAIGTPFDDMFVIKGLTVPRSVDGGDEVTGVGDRMTVDGLDKACTKFNDRVYVQGLATISYTDIEQVIIINNAATLQVAAIEINDGDEQRSMVRKIVAGFNGLVAFPNGASAAIKLTDNSNGMSVACTVTPIDADGFTHVVITFPAGGPDYGSLPNGAFTLHVIADQIMSSMGLLDGNGDGVVGTVGEDYASPSTLIFRTFGDFNGDRTSNLIDFAKFRDAFNVGPSDIFDAEGDGAVGLLDFAIFRLRFNILV